MKTLITKTRAVSTLICLFVFLGTIQLNAQCPAGTTWTSRTTAADNEWVSVTYGNGVFVAVSQDGIGNRVMTSPDGITWTSRTSATDNYWRSVTFGNGLFVAVSPDGTRNRVMTSPDGITWTSRTSAADIGWESVTYGNGLFVAVALTGINRVMTSPNGITWTMRTSAWDNEWRSITYGNGLFVAVSSNSTGKNGWDTGSNRVMTSSNGINWTIRTSAADNQWGSVTFGNGLFVAVAYSGSGNRVMTSPNGITWTSRSSAADNGWNEVTYGNGVFLAVSTDGKVMTSPDGIAWTIRASAADNIWQSVTYGNGLFIAVSQDGTGNRLMTSSPQLVTPLVSIATNLGNSITTGTSVTFTATSTNGGSTPVYQWKKNNNNVGSNSVTYTDAALVNGDIITCVLTSNDPCASPVIATSSGITMAVNYPCPAGTTWTSRTSAADVGWNSVTYGNGLFVAVASNGTGNGVMSSPDGITWTIRNSAANNGWADVTYGNGLFIAVAATGIGNRVMTSPDGITWTSRTSAADINWASVTYGNGLFVAVAQQTITLNRVMTSPDGITWTIRTAAAYNNWSDVTYGNGVFVAVASNATGDGVMTSPDGITWTSRTPAANNAWSDVTYANGIFVAVALSGTGNRVMTSPDGITWTIRTSAADNGWMSVTYGNGLFVAVSWDGAGNKVMTSPDGITWTIRTPAVNNNWFSVTFANGVFVAVSPNGTGNRVMTSSPQLVTPSVVIAANPGTSITTGTSVTFTVAPTNGGTTPAYQWKKNGNNVGINSATYTDAALANGDIIMCVLTSNNPCASTATATSTGITMAVLGAPTITSFTPTTAETGITVTITGSNFTGATAVSFGGTAATSFTLVNATTITAVVGSGASGNVSVTARGGTATLTGFTFCNPVTPTFATVASICSGATLATLPTTSSNAITGTWSPALNNLATTTYIFTPSVGQCANTTTLTITVNLRITPTFTALSAICSGATLAALPTTSNNAITGIWSPTLNNLATTTYTFTPSVGQCATIATLVIAVNTTTAPTAAAQILNIGSTVTNLAATGSNLQWYSNTSGGAALANTTVLSSGTYYVSQTLNGCESTRTSVAVTITIPSTLRFCSGSKLAEAIGTTSLKFYSALTGGTALVSTTTLTTRTYFATQIVNGLESTPRVAVAITAIALPATPATITGAAAQGALVGTTTTANYSIAAVAGASSYVWTAPTGVNIVSGQGTNAITINFTDVPAGAGAIGNLSVVAVNSNDCESLVRNLALTKALPTAPTAIRMTDATLPLINGIATAVTSFAQYMGTTRLVTLTATPVAGATAYEWELPSGVHLLSGATTNLGITSGTNEITVNFAEVTSGNTFNHTTTTGVLTHVLRIGVKALTGTGASTTSNAAAILPETNSTARLLTLRAVLPVAPSAIRMTDAIAVDPLRAVTVISNFIGTTKEFTLTATPSALARSYTWELPAGVTQLSGGNTNTITVNFANVASGTTSLYIGVKAVNGIGASAIATNGTLVPATTSTARLLRLSATVPATVTAIGGQIAGLCGNATYSYTITPTILATAYSITAPIGAIVQSANTTANNTNSLTTSDLIFTVTYPTGFVATIAAPKTLAVAAVNGVGTSTLSRSLNLSTLMPAIGTVIGSAGITNFRRTGTQTFTIPTVAGATSYTWTVANGAVITSGQGTTTVTVDFAAVPVAIATTKVAVIATNSCATNSAIKSVSLTSVAAREAAKAAVDVNATEVYPNPVSNNFNIDVTASSVGSLDIAIYSLDGNLVVSPKTVALQEGTNTITENVAYLPQGVYILQLVNISNNEVITKKMIKK